MVEEDRGMETQVISGHRRVVFYSVEIVQESLVSKAILKSNRVMLRRRLLCPQIQFKWPKTYAFYITVKFLTS